MKKQSIVLPAAIFLLVLVGFLIQFFSHDPLVGNWGNDHFSIEFLEDGSMQLEKLGRSISGEWARVSDDKVKFEYRESGKLKSEVFYTTFEDQKVTFTPADPDDKDEAQTLRRDFKSPQKPLD